LQAAGKAGARSPRPSVLPSACCVRRLGFYMGLLALALAAAAAVTPPGPLET